MSRGARVCVPDQAAGKFCWTVGVRRAGGREVWAGFFWPRPCSPLKPVPGSLLSGSFISVSEDLAQLARLAFPDLIDRKIKDMDVPVILVAKRCREFIVGLPIESKKTIVSTFADLKPSEKIRIIFLIAVDAHQNQPIVGP